MSNIKKNQKYKHDENKIGYALEKKNYILLIIGFLVIVIGFILMSGGKTDDPSVFNYDIHSFRRITLAPILVLLGFAIEFFAIMWIPKKNHNQKIEQ